MPTIETLFQTRWLGLFRIGHWDFVRRPNSDAAVGIYIDGVYVFSTAGAVMSLRDIEQVAVLKLLATN